MTAPTTRKPARVWRNFRIGKGGDDAMTVMRDSGGPHITRSDVVRECLAVVLGDDLLKRRVVRALQTENAKREDAENERRHREAARAARPAKA